jgi:hypothetical protein
MRKDNKQMKSIFDSLESVRGAIDDMLAAQERQFSPYDEIIGTMQTPFGYAGEMEDENRLVYLRARYYNRNTGTPEHSCRWIHLRVTSTTRCPSTDTLMPTEIRSTILTQVVGSCVLT